MFDQDETQAVCESATSDKVVKFVRKNELSQTVQEISYNGDLWGVYYDESGQIVAQDNQGEIYPAFDTDIEIAGRNYHRHSRFVLRMAGYNDTTLPVNSIKEGVEYIKNDKFLSHSVKDKNYDVVEIKGFASHK